MIPRRLVPLLLLTSLALGCDGRPFGPQVDLAEAQARWRAANLASYDYDFAVRCFCLLPGLGRVTISVRNGQFTGAVTTDSGVAVDSSAYRGYLTIDEVFGSVRRMIDQQAPQFSASYDPTLGYPVEASTSDPHVGDAYLTIQVLALRPLQTP
jgi:uncharacterized protein DUF6174